MRFPLGTSSYEPYTGDNQGTCSHSLSLWLAATHQLGSTASRRLPTCPENFKIDLYGHSSCSKEDQYGPKTIDSGTTGRLHCAIQQPRHKPRTERYIPQQQYSLATCGRAQGASVRFRCRGTCSRIRRIMRTPLNIHPTISRAGKFCRQDRPRPDIIQSTYMSR